MDCLLSIDFHFVEGPDSKYFYTTKIFGCIISYYPLMVVGRLLFGAGSESYGMAISPVICTYFEGKELALALGLTLSLSRIGSSANDVGTYYFYKQTNSIIFAISVGFVLLAVCFLLLLILIYCCMSKQKQISKASNIEKEKIIKIDAKQELLLEDAEDKSALCPSVGYMNDIEGLDESILSLQQKDLNDHQDVLEDQESTSCCLKDLKHFDAVYWLLVLNCGLIYGSITPWMNIGADYLEQRFGFDHASANQLLMIPYIIGGVFTPSIGYLSDLIGKRTQILFISMLCLLSSHYILGWNSCTYLSEVVIGLSGLGMALAAFCAVLWPSFAVVAREEVLGTAYGIPTSFYNAKVAVDYFLVGLLTKHIDGRSKYENVEYFLMGMSVVSFFSVCLLIVMDLRTGRRLNEPTIKK